MMLDKKFVEAIYRKEIISRRKQTYLNEAKRIFEDYKVYHCLDENQISLFKTTAIRAKAPQETVDFLKKKEEKAKHNHGWGRSINNVTLAKALQNFIETQIKNDVRTINNISEDLQGLSNEKKEHIVNNTYLILCREFIFLFAECYQLNKKGVTHV